MVNVSANKYQVYAVLSTGKQINITEAVTAGTWDEGEGEISARISCSVANVKFNGKPLSSTITPNTIIVITANSGSGEKEVIRGTVTEWNPSSRIGENTFTLMAYDELYNMQQSQDDRYITAGTGAKSAIMSMFNDWGIPVSKYSGPNSSLAKTTYKAQYLSDIIMDILDNAEKHGSDKFIVRAEAGKAKIIPIGSNKDIYHFSEDTNTVAVSDRITTTGMVTRVKIMGVADKEGKQSQEAIVDGKTKYGIRQRIYNRSSDDTVAQAKTAAQKIIDEEGEPERASTLTSPDVPFVRKGDKVHMDTMLLNGFFIIKTINHDIVNRQMTFNVTPAPKTPAKPDAEETPVNKKTYKVGDNVQFKGGKHYVSSTATTPASTNLSAGPARIAYTNPGSAHPWSLITTDWSKTHVYGWVDDGTFE